MTKSTLTNEQLREIVAGCADGVYPTTQEISMAAELLPIYEEAYKQAVANPDSDVVAHCLAGHVIQLAIKHVIDTMKSEHKGI